MKGKNVQFAPGVKGTTTFDMNDIEPERERLMD